jgi:hypothetical protein
MKLRPLNEKRDSNPPTPTGQSTSMPSIGGEKTLSVSEIAREVEETAKKPAGRNAGLLTPPPAGADEEMSTGRFHNVYRSSPGWHGI